MPESKEQVVLLGGGVAGLATAYEIQRRGHRVVVLEKNSEVGGLARTLEFDGFRFDIGGHRFHSNNPDVVNWVKDLLGPDLLEVPRRSHIRFGNKYVRYPIQFPDALGIFPPAMALRVIGSYLAAQFAPRNGKDRSFEDWVVRRFGWALYDVYFTPYTEKVWGIKTTELSAMWAAQRISLPSLGASIRNALMPHRNPPATAIQKFYYPREGFGMICDRLTEEIRSGGGEVLANASVTAVDPDNGAVSYQRDGQTHTITGTRIISTLPLTLLLRALPEETNAKTVVEQHALSYRDMIIVYLALKRDQVSRDSWTYFPDPELIFGRTHEPKNWSDQMVPSAEFTSLATEIFTSRGETIWEMTDEEIVDKVAEQMHTIDWIDRNQLINTWVMRIPFAYPVYHIDYEEKLRAIHDFLKQWDNLHLVGRTGAFKYMNSDGVIEDVFRLMRELYPHDPLNVQPLTLETERWA